MDVNTVQLDFGNIPMTNDGSGQVIGKAVQQAHHQQEAALSDILKFSAQKEQEDVLMQTMQVMKTLRVSCGCF